MSRTIAALYDSRAEAEFARARLVSRLKAKSPRIIAKDTVGAIDGLDIASADKDSYRQKVGEGAYLLVAEAPNGAGARRIVDILEEAIGRTGRRDAQQWGDGEQGVGVAIAAKPEPGGRAESTRRKIEQPGAPQEAEAGSAPGPVKHVDPPSRNLNSAPAEPAMAPLEHGSGERVRDALPSGARVRSFTHEAPAEEQVSLLDDVVTAENRPADRQLSDGEIDAGGLFQERVFEIAEMREEPIVTKVAVVREEVIVRKVIKKRTETIRDTVRRTDIEVEDLPSEEAGTLFFDQPATERSRRS